MLLGRRQVGRQMPGHLALVVTKSLEGPFVLLLQMGNPLNSGKADSLLPTLGCQINMSTVCNWCDVCTERTCNRFGLKANAIKDPGGSYGPRPSLLLPNGDPRAKQTWPNKAGGQMRPNTGPVGGGGGGEQE